LEQINNDRYAISVIVPIHDKAPKLQAIKESIAASSYPVELIIVVNEKDPIVWNAPTLSHERVIISKRVGRGYAFVKGAEKALGKITLLLHSDTVLPQKWDDAIMKAIGDGRIIGGAFSLSYDVPSLYLKTMIRVSDLFIRLTGEIWGDRAIFIRSDILRQCLAAIDVPLFEDVRLSKCMRDRGEVAVLKENVVTGADNFRKNGMIGHHWRVVKCRLWYALGGDPRDIYEYYYS
jgi:glycosyltransferase involved in cell wall biosynthesis